MCYIYNIDETWKYYAMPIHIYNIDETWKYYAKWKKPVTKDHKLYEMSIYTKCPE